MYGMKTRMLHVLQGADVGGESRAGWGVVVWSVKRSEVPPAPPHPTPPHGQLQSAPPCGHALTPHGPKAHRRTLLTLPLCISLNTHPSPANPHPPPPQGTNKPAHYHVLLDEIGFGADGIQLLTYWMCYLYQRTTKWVAVVGSPYGACGQRAGEGGGAAQPVQPQLHSCRCTAFLSVACRAVPLEHACGLKYLPPPPHLKAPCYLKTI